MKGERPLNVGSVRASAACDPTNLLSLSAVHVIQL